MALQPSDAVRALRASSRGDLRIDADTVRPVRYVIDRRRGVLVLPVPRDLEGVDEAQLLVPDEQDPSLACLLTIEPVTTPAPAAEIRFEVYHGEVREGMWAEGRIQALRYHTETFDADECSLIDRLIDHESALCQALNADRDALRRLCRHAAGSRVVDPIAVGVDPDGIDVRARFGVVRVEFDSSAPDADAARARIESLHDAAARASRA